MKIRTTEALKAFEKSVEQCAGSVYLKSVNGECYDLKKEELRSQGIRVESLAIIDRMDEEEGVVFRPQP